MKIRTDVRLGCTSFGLEPKQRLEPKRVVLLNQNKKNNRVSDATPHGCAVGYWPKKGKTNERINPQLSSTGVNT